MNLQTVKDVAEIVSSAFGDHWLAVTITAAALLAKRLFAAAARRLRSLQRDIKKAHIREICNGRYKIARRSRVPLKWMLHFSGLIWRSSGDEHRIRQVRGAGIASYFLKKTALCIAAQTNYAAAK